MHLPFSTLHIIYWLAAMNLLALLLYWLDKRAARQGGWRIPEATLLMVALLGGSPASFVAQRVLRHKNRKTSFQVRFWIVVLVQLGGIVYLGV